MSDRGTSAAAPPAYNMKYVGTICLVAAMGGLLFGYDWVVIGGAKPFFERCFQLQSDFVRGWANSCALVGCLLGALAAGALSDRFGRKRLLVLCAMLFTATSIGNGLAPSFPVFVTWRILGGVAIGLASSLSPMYIAEVAPARMRGRLVAINQLTIVIGILLAQVVNWLLVRGLPKGAGEEFMAQSWYVLSGWRWMFGLTAVPSLVFFVSMFAVPESPRWMVKNRQPDRARRVLAKIGGDPYAAAALAEIQATLTTESRKVGYRELLAPGMRRVLVLGVVLAVFQQWCGINVIFNYAEEIFKAAGYDISSVLANIAWTGSVNLAFTFVALGTVDRGGRRPLMLFGAAALAVIYTTMGLCYQGGVQGLPMLLLVLAAIGAYAMSLAPVTWVVVSEIFPNRIRGAAMAVAVSSLWIACFILTYTFPILNQRLAPTTFSAGDFPALPEFAAKLRQPSSEVARYLSEQLPPEVSQLVAGFDPESSDSAGLRAALAEGLNRIIRSEAIYDQGRFAGVELSSAAKAILSQEAAQRDTVRLNRLLLEDAFRELRRSQSVGAARTFWIYAAICVAGFLFILKRLPETKGKTLEELEKDLVG